MVHPPNKLLPCPLQEIRFTRPTQLSEFPSPTASIVPKSFVTRQFPFNFLPPHSPTRDRWTRPLELMVQTPLSTLWSILHRTEENALETQPSHSLNPLHRNIGPRSRPIPPPNMRHSRPMVARRKPPMALPRCLQLNAPFPRRKPIWLAPATILRPERSIRIPLPRLNPRPSLSIVQLNLFSPLSPLFPGTLMGP